MINKNVAVLADCICDLPEELIEKYDIYIIYHYIYTEKARFRDRDEISSQNVFDYMAAGGMLSTENPDATEYAEIFRKNLKRADEIIYVAMAAGMATAYQCAMEARELLGTEGSRVHIIDTKHLSSAIGHVVLRAAKMADSRRSAAEIIEECERLVEQVRCSFIVKNVDYLHKNGFAGNWLHKICSTFNIHPVLTMKNGKMAVKSVFFGDYEKSQIKYIRSEMKNSELIRKKRLFITHAGCTVKEIAAVRAEVEKYCIFEETLVTSASATISSNCGPHTIGVLYVLE